MLKLKVVLVVAVAAFAVAVLPSAASATVDVTCSVDCSPSAPWVNHAVSVTFTWADGTGEAPTAGDCGTSGSGRPFTSSVSCSVDGGPDGPSSATATIRVDTDPPTHGTISPTSAPNANGWYTSAPSFNFHWDGGPSGFSSCPQVVTYSGDLGPGKVVHGTCVDGAGNASGADSPAFNIDTGPPVNVAGAPTRLADHNGWFNHPLTLAWTGTDPASGIASCTTATYAGPDSASTSVPGSCTNGAGLSAAAPSAAFRYDDTPPSVSGAAASRFPDHNGWYNHPVAFAFQGTDATSGIAACSSAGYSGPSDSTATLKGSCTDNAGNVGTKTITFKYDDTAPDKAKLFAVPANGAIDINWAPPSDGDSYVLTRAPAIGGAAPVMIYQGSAKDFVDKGLKNGTKYNYLLTVYDAAGNASPVSGISAVPDGSTLRPFLDTAVKNPPLLTWGRIKKARYYNLQLFKGRKKILSTWPKRAHLQLTKSWKFNRHRYKLTPGLYRWYVWPGLGNPKRHRYGALVGSSTFRVVP